MRRPASKIVAAAALAGVALIAVSGARFALRRASSAQGSSDDMPCGAGFFRRGPRCCPTPEPALKLGDGLCMVDALPSASCPEPLVATPRGCDSPERSVVVVPATSVLIGPSDWEAEGRVKPRTVTAGPFEIDRFEVSIGNTRCASCPPTVAMRLAGRDVARAASAVTLSEARALCAARGGRLPTEDEWIVAAAGAGPRRYPWGDTGAVCRRAAWGLTRGPCATGATGPDTVGSHPDGATPLGIHDLAGNAAEWVEPVRGAHGRSGEVEPVRGADGRSGEVEPVRGADGRSGEVEPASCDAGTGCLGVVRGGSYVTDLATDLRTWVRREVPAESLDATIGFRCAYDIHR